MNEERTMSAQGSSEVDVRQPVVAGAFYTADSASLSSEIDRYLRNVSKKEVPKKPIGLISPHAGYMYSGQVAANAYKLVEGKQYDEVIVFAPSHRAYFSGASLDRKSGYHTPLGTVPINRELVEEIIQACSLASFHEQAHGQEHSLEVQLPFLQMVLENFSLIAIIMGDQDIRTCETIVRCIAEVLQGRNVLIVASSDLSHYHPYDQAKELDQKVLDYINAFDPHGLASALSKHRIEACGGGPIITALLLGKQMGATKAEVVNYANSGDVSGDYSGVVGYAAGVIY